MLPPNLVFCPPRLLICAWLMAASLLFPIQARGQVQWNLIFSDEFNGATNSLPDTTKWAYDSPNSGSGNMELETYCGQAGAGQTGDCSNWVQNAYQDGQGSLVIAAILHPDGKWTSARLMTHGKFTFTYGRVEARMKLPVGVGLWPAVWMLGENIFSGTTWPNCGEQDLMESVLPLGASTIRSSVHGTNYSGNNSLHANFTLPDGGRVDSAYHVYGVVWTTNSIQYYVDDYTKPFAAFTPARMPTNGVWAFNNHAFFLLLNLAVGGTFPGNPDGTTPNPANLYVDYVRVYQRAPSPGLYEAENAVVSGAMTTNYYAGYAGIGYVDYQHVSGDFVEWTVNAPFGSVLPLQFRYANGNGAISRLELKINGALVNSALNFPVTASWNTWSSVSNQVKLNPGTNTIRLTTTGVSGPNLDYMLVGSGSNAPAALALRVPFADAPGATTTPSDSSSGGANVTLQMLNSSGVPTDFHGATGSGVSQLARALDFSSDSNGGLISAIPGATARATNQSNLGFGTVTSFTATVWFKLDSMFTNSINRGARVFLLGANGITDQGATNSISLGFFNQSQLQYKVHSNIVAVIYGSAVPTNQWFYYALVYDGSAASVYAGSETSPATLIATTNNLTGPQVINFGASGSLLVGNRIPLDRALDGWIQDVRFYTYAANSNLVEDIRWSAIGPASLTAAAGNNQVNLSWGPLAGAVSYTVWRSTTNGSGYRIIATGITGTAYADATALSGTTYYYVVSAVDSSGSGKPSQNSNQASVTAPPPGLLARYSTTNLALSWPTSAAGFNLYSTPSLAPTINWLRVTNPPVTQGGNATLNLPVDVGTQFFRLSLP